MFRNARSQAVRIPARWEFPTKRVLIRRDGDRLILEPIHPAGLADHLGRHIGVAVLDSAPLAEPFLIDVSVLFALVQADEWTPTLLLLARADLATDEMSATHLRAGLAKPEKASRMGRGEDLLSTIPILPRSDAVSATSSRIVSTRPPSDVDYRGFTPWVAAQAMTSDRTLLTARTSLYDGIDRLRMRSLDSIG